jgi:hypothetical protein
MRDQSWCGLGLQAMSVTLKGRAKIKSERHREKIIGTLGIN